ncbi:MAG: endonuclease/exonuclease/phosphatase family protein [Bacillota bacterium]
MTYNIRHGKGMDGKVDLGRTARTISSARPDLVGLQEVDHLIPRSRMQKQANLLAQRLRMRHVFGPTISLCLGRYGNALLSRYPILSHRNHRLPGAGERRGFLEVRLRVMDQDLYVFNTHLGLNNKDRRRQVVKILQVAGRCPGPVLLIGDFNARPGSAELVPLTPTFIDTAAAAGAPRPTFPANAPLYRIDYIFASPHWEITASATLDSQASDHLPVHTRLTHFVRCTKLRSTFNKPAI